MNSGSMAKPLTGLLPFQCVLNAGQGPRFRHLVRQPGATASDKPRSGRVGDLHHVPHHLSFLDLQLCNRARCKVTSIAYSSSQKYPRGSAARRGGRQPPWHDFHHPDLKVSGYDLTCHRLRIPFIHRKAFAKPCFAEVHYEGNPQAPEERAYVFITNVAVHRHLDLRPVFVVAPIGFRIPNSNRPGEYTLIEKYRADQKYKEVFAIADALGASGKFPATFDGSLPSDNLDGEPERLRIGQTYHFTDAVPGGLVGTVQSAVVDEGSKKVHVVVNTPDGKGHILAEQMSDAAFQDYLANKDAYFGELQQVNAPAKTPYEFFCRMMEIYADYDRRQLAIQLSMKPDDPRIANLSDQQLREHICEQMAAHAASQSQ